MLFSKYEIPRRPPRKMMHVADAGHLPGGSKGIRFKCSHCGHDTGWIADEWTITENRRGHPCPVCNGPFPRRCETRVSVELGECEACGAAEGERCRKPRDQEDKEQ